MTNKIHCFIQNFMPYKMEKSLPNWSLFLQHFGWFYAKLLLFFKAIHYDKPFNKLFAITGKPLIKRDLVQYQEIRYETIEKPVLPLYYTKVNRVFPVPKDYKCTTSICSKKIMAEDKVVRMLSSKPQLSKSYKILH